ncbi:PREDICTED: trafficking protein particle complex subunit 4 [Wasmannia auropunctata]|uniref:trafficking protein particle complex subunit 4 n=1 Tax=Wasmannia auropunctata TaxID=64793 RepID=UPI0005EF3713|nr:PREDICTED: trafficking protein particle complex subunit 4 [Wasmannia auropunctata]XP_011705759.1 PREDICTED: trafficking protein particle complex subunit 4 [Wasmannia auropunctata]XP_011705760.1 PREDICTED: trafficking protein particle complex subunit 4 [Wasmannia auropunctata]XP_011705761.1 PREDICTED: trafficking protein particle complex subunit 4 [Wasmannia auropunctata]XP_011705762.1 PREDICTED: trafficking protein particle complex subunit 4 [Wasmannia auropunctata]XP_011705763.1 PREDICTED:
MVIYGVYIVSKSGGLIFNHDHNVPKIEVEKSFNFPLNIKLNYENKKIVVAFGQKDGIHVGHVLTAVNGAAITGRELEDGRDILEMLEQPENFPITLKFSRAKMTTNEKIFLASMFYPLFAIASQLSPEPRSSGIEILEADTFRLYCFQTLTGIKFMIVAEPSQPGVEILLKRVYDLYADYALKNPFYALEMPIRCELFETNLQTLLETVEKSGISNV